MPDARGLLHHFRPHAVAVLEPVGHVKIGATAGELDGRFENHHRRGAIHVVIAVDQDFFAIPNGSAKPLERGVHAQQQMRIVQRVQAGMQELAGASGVADAAAVENAGGRGADA